MPWAFWIAYSQRLGLLALMLGALYLIGRALRSGRAFGARHRRIAVLESTMIGPHATIHIVRVEERRLLLGATPRSVALLAELVDEANATR